MYVYICIYVYNVNITLYVLNTCVYSPFHTCYICSPAYNEMSSTAIADLLIPFCEAASISTKSDAAGILKKRFIVSLCFADYQALHGLLFMEQHMDWPSIKEYLTLESSAYSIGDWIHLLSLFDFVNEPKTRQIVLELVAGILAGGKVSQQGKQLTPLETLRLCFARAGLVPSWDILCKALLLCNLTEIDHAAALQQFLAILPEFRSAQSDTVAKFLSSCKHIPEEYTLCFSEMLLPSNCHVRTHFIMQSFQARSEHVEKLQKDAHAMYHAHRKPSLTLILQQKGEKQNSNEDSFEHFCRQSLMASSAVMPIKRAAYYIVCLQLPNVSEELKQLVGGDTIVLEALLRIRIVAPELAALKAFLTEAHHTGPPSQALRLFKDACVPSGSFSTHWTTVLRLYLAAYSKTFKKELWEHVLFHAHSTGNDVLDFQQRSLFSSTETEVAVQAFVQQNAMALAEIVRLLLL